MSGSNLAHRVTICNMAWLLHFLTVGRYFQLAEGTCLQLQRSGGSLWLIFFKNHLESTNTSKKDTTLRKIRVFFHWRHGFSLLSIPRPKRPAYLLSANEGYNLTVVCCKRQLSTKSLCQMLCGSHIKIWNLANHMKKWNKEHQTLSFQFFINRSSIFIFLFCFSSGLQDFKF